MARTALFLSALVFAAMQTALPARAQEFPSKQTVRIIVPFLPGAANDTLARITAAALTPRLGQSVIVENKAGAGSAIGTDFVAKSPADGYTLLWGGADGMSVLPAVKPNLAYKVPEDFTFICQFSETVFAVVVSSQLPIKSVPEFVAYAKANPGKIRYGTSGVGSIAHVGFVLLENRAGIEMVHVPYKGMSAVVTDLLGGHIEMAYVTPQTIFQHADSSKIRIIATTGSRRAPLFPNLPTLKESGLPEVVVETWFGVVGPANLPANIAARLQREIGEVLKDPEVIAKLKSANFEPYFVPSEPFRKYVVDDLNKWKSVAQRENIVITE
jgi:tripartite-type tricarboxylate transporter receptor subunit TctC